MIPLAQSGVTDTEGLICGFALRAGAATPIDWDPRNRARIDAAAPVWLHFNLADTRACHWIETHTAIPEDARELLLENDSHIRCEVFDQSLALVLGDLHHDFNGDPDGFGVLRIYIDRNLIITGRRHPLRAVDQVRRHLLHGQEVISTAALLAHLIETTDQSFQHVLKPVGERLDEVEDDILATRVQEHGSELGRTRRLLARLRRHMGSGRHALHQAVAAMSRWVERDDADELRQTLQDLEGTHQDLELVQERTRLLQEEIASQLNEATNRNLYILSVVTVALLPINLITGIWGMNTGGLPWSHDPSGFWWVMFWMVITVAAALRFLHSKKIL